MLHFLDENHMSDHLGSLIIDEWSPDKRNKKPDEGAGLMKIQENVSFATSLRKGRGARTSVASPLNRTYGNHSDNKQQIDFKLNALSSSDGDSF